MDATIIANRIKMLREENNMLQQELADKMRERGVKTTRVAISKWECGKHIPETNSLRVLAEIFGVSMAYMAGMSDKRSGLIATQYSADYPEDDMPLLDENGEPMIYSDERAIRQTLRENRELRMLLSASSKLNKDDLEQLIRLAKLMDKE